MKVHVDAEFMQFVYWLKKQSEKELKEVPVPKPVQGIADKLRDAGHQVYLVGGAVRDIQIQNKALEETITWCDQTIAKWKEHHPDWKPEEIRESAEIPRKSP